ncbi:hypothetical protein ACLOJK_014558 [Asimina triloba]
MGERCFFYERQPWRLKRWMSWRRYARTCMSPNSNRSALRRLYWMPMRSKVNGAGKSHWGSRLSLFSLAIDVDVNGAESRVELKATRGEVSSLHEQVAHLGLREAELPRSSWSIFAVTFTSDEKSMCVLTTPGVEVVGGKDCLERVEYDSTKYYIVRRDYANNEEVNLHGEGDALFVPLVHRATQVEDLVIIVTLLGH